jgi:O-antigen ligase
MGRNLYILAATLGLLALIAFGVSFTHAGDQLHSPGDAALWRVTSLGLVCASLIVALLGILSSLFEQAERRASTDRQARRRHRSS